MSAAGFQQEGTLDRFVGDIVLTARTRDRLGCPIPATAGPDERPSRAVELFELAGEDLL